MRNIIGLYSEDTQTVVVPGCKIVDFCYTDGVYGDRLRVSDRLPSHNPIATNNAGSDTLPCLVLRGRVLT